MNKKKLAAILVTFVLLSAGAITVTMALRPPVLPAHQLISPENADFLLLLTPQNNQPSTRVFDLRETPSVRDDLTHLLAGHQYEEKIYDYTEISDGTLSDSVLLYDSHRGWMGVDLIAQDYAVLYAYDNQYYPLTSGGALVEEIQAYVEENSQNLVEMNVLPQGDGQVTASAGGLSFHLPQNFSVPPLNHFTDDPFLITTKSGSQYPLTIRSTPSQTAPPDDLENLGDTLDSLEIHPYTAYETLDPTTLLAPVEGYPQGVPTIYATPQGFITQAGHLPHTSLTGEAYGYQIALHHVHDIEGATNPQSWKIQADFYLDQGKITISTQCDDLTEGEEVASTLLSLAESFQIAPDGLQEIPLFWFRLQAVA